MEGRLGKKWKGCRGALLWWGLVLVVIGATACAQPPTPQQGVEAPADANLALAKEVKQVAEALRPVEQSTAVVIANDVSVAIRVTGFDRFRLKQIRTEVHSRVRDLVPATYRVHVTSDRRLYHDLQRIEYQINETEGVASPTVQDQLKKINQDMQG